MTPPLVSEVGIDRLQAVVGALLDVDLAHADPRTPFTAYGLDSLKAMELVSALEEACNCRLPEWLLLDCPDFATLAEALRHGPHGGEASHAREMAGLFADAVLPDDIAPAAIAHASPAIRRVLLTGATGFLGAWLLRTLLDETDLDVVCLVRQSAESPADRIRWNLERFGLRTHGDDARIQAIAAEISRPGLGLPIGTYQDVAETVQAVYHAAADVNWVTPYAGLRAPNVTATTELLRLACTQSRKAFHFISSLSVCYAVDGPAEVVESADMLPFAGRLPLGYAQSKCVAESLVREAALRGLPATIFRPALLAGDSSTGASTVEDLTAALLKGCIQMQAAPDLDWTFDAAPVDVAAKAIVRVAAALPADPSAAPNSVRTVHVRHPRPRHWRECVLWANLFGYPMRLEPYETWLERLDREAGHPNHPLHRLRGFFLRRVNGRTVPEHYQTGAQRRVSCSESRQIERRHGISYPQLDADLLNRYFDDYIRRGHLPRPLAPRRSVAAGGAHSSWQSAAHFERLLRASFADPTLQVANVDLVNRGSDHSVVSELTSWRGGRTTGLFHCRLGVRMGDVPRTMEVMVKVKPSDEDVLHVAETTAAVCDPRVSDTLRTVRDLIGVSGCHVREVALYAGGNGRLRRYQPACHGTWRDDEGGSWGIVLERLTDMAVIDAADGLELWSDEAIRRAIEGLAAIHAVWLGRDAELRAKPWIGHVPTTADVGRLQPFWRALADHAAPRFRHWAGSSIVSTHRRLVDSAPDWRATLDGGARTLIHNDFNPRNIGLRRCADGLRLVAYDWELATIGAPQRDLAELLCFVLPEDVALSRVRGLVETHRRELERESGVPLDAGFWWAGFTSALADVLVARLAFYALVDRVRPQPFLARVVRTWRHLHVLCEGLETT
jgi:thioester reductase-like protein